jgi:hypothetical protein
MGGEDGMGFEGEWAPFDLLGLEVDKGGYIQCPFLLGGRDGGVEVHLWDLALLLPGGESVVEVRGEFAGTQASHLIYNQYAIIKKRMMEGGWSAHDPTHATVVVSLDRLHQLAPPPHVLY